MTTRRAASTSARYKRRGRLVAAAHLARGRSCRIIAGLHFYRRTCKPMSASAPVTLTDLDWRFKPFNELTTTELYDLLEARCAVFIVEQTCVYGDIDGLDKTAWHLLAYDGRHADAKLAGYLRVLPPDATTPDLRIGRVLTTSGFRGIGLGNALLARALDVSTQAWRDVAISLHAQAHLQGYYGAFGFEPSSDVHDEDGIPHVWMRRALR
jgi:ElaA protein